MENQGDAGTHGFGGGTGTVARYLAMAGAMSLCCAALTVAKLVIDKFGGDSLREMERNYKGYCEQIRAY